MISDPKSVLNFWGRFPRRRLGNGTKEISKSTPSWCAFLGEGGYGLIGCKDLNLKPGS